MNKNVGRCDRGIRVIIGLAILGLGYYFECWLGLLGFIPILTAAFNWCPLYLPFGLNTCRSKKN